ncbi:MAG: dihydrofolate reductase family protein [Mariprofundus sp.]|nr:dihydrofolate reductase family protein [Mariprofundus sp.]
MTDILQLHPQTQLQCSLKGLYLKLNLHQIAAPSELFMYANYISSVDGRIALRDAESGEFMVPDNIANKRDWRLYQELAAQADVMITSARYFRQLAIGKAQDLLPVGTAPEYSDLTAWRAQQGLNPQPDVVIISNSLELPVRALAQLNDRRVIVCTSKQADDEKVNQLKASGLTVLIAGHHQVEGKQLKQQLIEFGYRSAYMIAGPAVHHTLISEQVLDHLFLTTRLNLLAGNAYHTILNGNMSATELELLSLYLDTDISCQQLFAQYRLKR